MNDTEMRSDSKDENNGINLEQYRRLVRIHLDMRRYRTALFWSEKVCVLSEYDAKDVYWMAHCMFMLRDYHRVVHIIKHRGLEKTNIFCHFLLIESLYEANEYQEALDLLSSIDIDFLTSSVMNGTSETCSDESTLNILSTVAMDPNGPSKSEILASICLLKGKILEALDNRTLAMDAYIEALHLSVNCSEAIDALVQHEMLLESEERELLAHLPVDSQCSNAEKVVLQKLYESKMKKYYETTNSNWRSISGIQSASGNSKVIKSILEFTERTKIERANSEFKSGTKDSSKLFTPIQQNIMSPQHKYLNDLKSTPIFSLQSSLSKHANTSSAQVTPVQVSKTTINTRKRNAANTPPVTTNQTLIPVQIVCSRLDQSVDMITAKAESLFYNNEYKNCSQVLEELLKRDPYHCAALIVLVGCFMELKEYNKLFCLAHKLVDLYSDQAISWYAVGCYYDLIGKSDPARRYLSKATTIDKQFGPAWLAYGHSFAKENEHDQAMAAYFKATQLMRGCHLPLLYIGVECGLTKNLDLAEKFFYQAMSLAPLDVNVLHELGVIKFECDCYEDAEEILRTTLKIVTKMAEENREPISPRWEPLVNNLGHCCRKNKRYADAIRFHEQALVLKPQSPASYTAIGFVYALQGKVDRAVDYLHRSLALKRDDIVTTALLKQCLEELMDTSEEDDEITKELGGEKVFDCPDQCDMEIPKSSWMSATASSSSSATQSKKTTLKSGKVLFEDDSYSSDIDLDMSMD